MPRYRSMFAGDEELGKKDDDHRPRNGSIVPPSGSTWGPMPRMRRRRLLVLLAASLFLYVFVKNIPTDLGPSKGQIARISLGGGSGQDETTSPAGPPPRSQVQSEAEKHHYNGIIKFYSLSISLYGISKTLGYKQTNKNVLFAAGNLHSMSKLVPIACEMARWNRNYVHLVFMGRENTPMDIIQEVNGVEDNCGVYWHDARPDYGPWSSDPRMEFSVTEGLDYINGYMHPQAIITDDSTVEEAFFIRGIRKKANEIGKSIIELPSNAAQTLMWITRLDTGSLKAWHKTYVDILIHAPPDSSGSLIRLLRSIETADYSSFRRPRLTVELPPDIDPPTRQFLETIVWPPIDPSGSLHSSQVQLRHRLSREGLTTQDASTHLIESFYPARPKDSHVLLLSPQAELSQNYYHYVMYNLLEYKYSSYGLKAPESKNIMGFSLELPLMHLNDSKSFTPPPPKAKKDGESTSDNEQPRQFIWQAPNSNAALYFGEKWMELHSFLGNRISAQKRHLPVDQRPQPRRKQVSEKYPAWMEYILELIRARDYYMLYPNFPSSESIVTVHNELYQIPEEFITAETSPTPESTPLPAIDPNDPYVVDPATHAQRPSTNSEPPLLSMPLLSMLPPPGDLPELSDIPLLSYSGEILSPSDAGRQAVAFGRELRREIGGCGDTPQKPSKPLTVEGLFCLDEEEEEEEIPLAPPPKLTDHKAKTKDEAEEEKQLRSHNDNKIDPSQKEETAAEFAAHLDRQAGNNNNNNKEAGKKKSKEGDGKPRADTEKDRERKKEKEKAAEADEKPKAYAKIGMERKTENGLLQGDDKSSRSQSGPGTVETKPSPAL